ncbi:MAG: hypothetical protein WCA04_08850 [Geobacteraceae bacterium]
MALITPDLMNNRAFSHLQPEQSVTTIYYHNICKLETPLLEHAFTFQGLRGMSEKTIIDKLESSQKGDSTDDIRS